MTQISTLAAVEVILATKGNSTWIARRVKQGQLRKLAPRLYTSNLRDPLPKIVSRNLHQIISLLYPKAIISHRSALEARPTRDGQYFLTYRFTKRHSLPGLTLRLIKGPMTAYGTTAFMGDLFISKRERAWLENLQPSRKRELESKVISQEKLEKQIDEICRVHGEDYLNRIRDDSRLIANRLGMKPAFRKLERIISAILATHSPKILSSQEARARSLGASYEPARMERFRILFEYLRSRELPSISQRKNSKKGFETQAFFEAYFSNYIEGTRFEIEEARKIVYEGMIPENRPEGHDIVGTYNLIVDPKEMGTLPRDANHFLNILRHRHRTIMAAHGHLQPGDFKEKRNQAGSTLFVEPSAVRGTLLRGFEYYELLQDPLKQAIYMMFLVAEVHPFNDGNGRVARIMMNSVLFAARQERIIVPNVFRTDYMGSLKTLTKNDDPAPLVKAMLTCLQFTSRIDFSTYEAALISLKQKNAFADPEEAKLVLT